jgi:hypothetical protein
MQNPKISEISKRIGETNKAEKVAPKITVTIILNVVLYFIYLYPYRDNLNIYKKDQSKQ